MSTCSQSSCDLQFRDFVCKIFILLIKFLTEDAELSPLEVSSALNGISCSLSFLRDYNIKFVTLLKEVVF